MLKRVVIGVLALAAVLVSLRAVLLSIPAGSSAPKYTRALLTPLPAPETNGFVPFAEAAAHTTSPDFDNAVLVLASWDEVKRHRANGLDLDFDRAAWAEATRLDEHLVVRATFAETCEPTAACALMPVGHGLVVLMVRVLVLSRRGELDEAESLLMRLRVVTAQWDHDARTLLGATMARIRRLQVEQLAALLRSPGSPLRERLVFTCEPGDAPTTHPQALVFEAVAFHERIATELGSRSSYWQFDRRETQQMVDACTTLLLALPTATCSTAGLDALPDRLHNKLGRALAGAQNVTTSGAVRGLVDDGLELETWRAKNCAAH